VEQYYQPKKTDYKAIKDYKDFQVMADLYYAYDLIFKYIEEPFSNDLVNIGNFGLFNSCKLIVNKVNSFNSSHRLKGLSLSYVFFALAFLSKQLEAYKTARFSFERLNTLIIPQSWQDKIDYEIISIRSKPYLDKDNLMPLCYRCLNNNPLLNTKGDICTTCGGEFIRSPLSNEILPLVEFKPKQGISLEDAINYVKSNKKGNKSKKQFTETSGKNTLIIHNTQSNSSNDDLFGMKLVEWCESQVSNEEYGTFEVDEEILMNLNESEVFVVDSRPVCPTYVVRFFKNRMHDMAITMCKKCYKFFSTEEYENNFLKKNCCPYCKG